MLELLDDVDRPMIVAGAFRLVFTRLGDRWVHALENLEVGAAGHRVLAISMESDPARDDPGRVVSPTYQDLQFQRAGPRIQALLVGQSGPHHFSAVITVGRGEDEPIQEWPKSRPRHGVHVDFDVADRCRGRVEALASTYTVAATSSELIQAMPNLAAWDTGLHRLTLYEPHDSTTQVAWAEAGRRATLAQVVARIDPSGSTHRFQYHWYWEPDLRTKDDPEFTEPS